VTELIFVVLRELYEGSLTESCNIDLDLTAASSAIWMQVHVPNELLQGMLVWPRTDIEHNAVFRPDMCANTLEEPLMTIDLAVISLFNSENEVDPIAL
jgi:hypothetical protein